MKVAFFSTGIPDPSQGGSGIFNYLLCDFLLRRGDAVTAYFRMNENFLKKHCTQKYLEELKTRGLICEFVYEHDVHGKLSFGWNYLLQQHQYEVCRNLVEQEKENLKQFDACIALDMGWAMALSALDLPKICFLGDPLHERLKFQDNLAKSRLHRSLQKLRGLSLSMAPKQLRERLKSFDGQRSLLASFGPQHAKEFRQWGLACRHFRWFTPRQSVQHQYRNPKGKLVLLHVGSLYGTASRQFLHYWAHDLLPALGKLPFDIEIRFVGKFEESLAMPASWKNIRVEYTGSVDALDQEFQNADMFFSPMKYPVGVRTRIVTALSYGMPVCADPSASFGLPELVSGRDILYGSTPEQIAAILQETYANPSRLRELGKNARTAWERYFEPEKNMNDIINALSTHS